MAFLLRAHMNSCHAAALASVGWYYPAARCEVAGEANVGPNAGCALCAAIKKGLIPRGRLRISDQLPAHIRYEHSLGVSPSCEKLSNKPVAVVLNKRLDVLV
jgi:hypothetical protein